MLQEPSKEIYTFGIPRLPNRDTITNLYPQLPQFLGYSVVCIPNGVWINRPISDVGLPE